MADVLFLGLVAVLAVNGLVIILAVALRHQQRELNRHSLPDA